MQIEIKVDQSGFTGSALVEIKKFTERTKMLRELNLKTNTDGEVEVLDETLDQADALQEIGYKSISKVNLKHESGLEVTSLEELEIYAEGEEIIQLLVSYVLNGVKLSKE